MKLIRIFTILFLIFICSSLGFSRARYNGIAEKGGKIVQTSVSTSYKLMETYPNCTVTVYLTGTTTLASIFSDNAGTVKANPFNSDSINASYFFYANNGIYDIKFSGTGITTPFTKANITLIDVTTIGNSILLKTNNVSNGSQTILNLKSGGSVSVADDGVGGITITGTGVILKINGVSNGSQTILNLKPGSNISLVDDGVGGITISASATSGGLTTITCGNTDDTAVLAAADAISDSTNIIAKGTTCASSSQTLASTWKIRKGGFLRPLNNQTITLTGPHELEDYQEFTNALGIAIGQGVISFNGNKYINSFKPEPWGAKKNDGVDDTSAINAAIVAAETTCVDPSTPDLRGSGCGEFVFGRGDYNIGSGISSGSIVTIHRIGTVRGIRGSTKLIVPDTLSTSVDAITISPSGFLAGFSFRGIQVTTATFGAHAGRNVLTILTGCGTCFVEKLEISGNYLGTLDGRGLVLNNSGAGVTGGTFTTIISNNKIFNGLTMVGGSGAGDTITITDNQFSTTTFGAPQTTTPMGIFVNLTLGAVGPYFARNNVTTCGGIQIASATGFSIIDNTFEPCIGYNGAIIDLDPSLGSTGIVSGGRIEGNRIAGSVPPIPDSDGIRSNGANSIYIASNTFRIPIGKVPIKALAGSSVIVMGVNFYEPTFSSLSSFANNTLARTTYLDGLSFSQMNTQGDGITGYCPDCTVANPCAGGGTGAFFKRLGGVWICN